MVMATSQTMGASVTQYQRDAREQLIRDAEERPERINSAERILHALPQKISPCADHHGAGGEYPGRGTGFAQRFPDMSAEFLHHETAPTRAGVQHGENEKRFEHDREVIPDAEQAFAADGAAENLRHAYGEGGRAAGAVEQGVFTHALRERGH